MTRVAVACLAIVAAMQPMTYRHTDLSAERRADDLLSRMSLDEKIGQMTQADSGALRAGDVARLRLGSVLSGGSSKPPM